MTTLDCRVKFLSVSLALCILSARAALGDDKPRTEFPGGEVHVATTQVDGVKFQIEMQFFKTAQSGSCWDAVGRDAKGGIYLGCSTQRTTTYVYRLDPSAGKMRYLGDLYSNVRYGGAEGRDNGKVHSGFMEWADGCIYFPSHVGAGEDKLRYGGHLWKYDPRQEKFVDLGIPDPGNTNFCMSSIDPVRNVAYMVSTPAGLLIRYDFKKQSFTALALTGKDWVRYLPVDSAGNVYILGGNRIENFDPDKGTLSTVATCKSVEAETGFDSVLGAFCWSRGRQRLFCVSYLTGGVFSWKVGATNVEFLGNFHPSGADLDLRTLYLNGEQTRLYAIGHRAKGVADKALYMFDIVKGKGFGEKLLDIEAILDKELGGRGRGAKASVHFSDYGGVTGDDGTMYCGFHGGGRDQDLFPGGLSVVALAAIRVKEPDAKAAEPLAPVPSSATGTPPRTATAPPAASEAVDLAVPAWARPSTAPDAASVTAVGMVDDYRPVGIDADLPPGKYVPLAYWVNVKAVPGDSGSKDAVLLVDSAKTGYAPPLDRHFLHGWRLRYTGRPVPANGIQSACVDTSVAEGKIELVLDGAPAVQLADFVVGKHVAFEGRIEPRQAWMEPFAGEAGQNWRLIVTLVGGAEVDIGDLWLWESKNFQKVLKLMRARRAVKVRVQGEVFNAAPYKSPKRPNSPRDVRGSILVAVEELRILGDEAAVPRDTPPPTQPGGPDAR